MAASVEAEGEDEPKAVALPEPVAEAEPLPEPEPEPEALAEPEVVAEAEAVEPYGEPEPEPEGGFEPEPEPEGALEQELEPGAEAVEPEPEPEGALEPELEQEPEPELEQEPEPELVQEPEPDLEPESARAPWAWAADPAVEAAREQRNGPAPKRRFWQRRPRPEPQAAVPKHVRVLPPEPSFDQQFPLDERELDPWEQGFDISVEEPEGPIDGPEATEAERELAEVPGERETD